MSRFLFVVTLSFLLSSCTWPFSASKPAALQINSEPSATVYLNNSSVGQTPWYDNQLKPGSYQIKLLLANDPATEWVRTVQVRPAAVTVLEKNFGANEEESSFFQLDLLPLQQASSPPTIEVLSLPEYAIINLNGTARGFTPIIITDAPESDHILTISAPGYQTLEVSPRTLTGFNLKVSASLARLSFRAEAPVVNVDELVVPLDTSTESAGQDQTGSQVTISNTDTGWLRVRSGPDTSAVEVAKVYPDQSFSILELSSDNQWVKIEYDQNQTGWISLQYTTQKLR